MFSHTFISKIYFHLIFSTKTERKCSSSFTGSVLPLNSCDCTKDLLESKTWTSSRRGFLRSLETCWGPKPGHRRNEAPQRLRKNDSVLIHKGEAGTTGFDGLRPTAKPDDGQASLTL